MHVSFVSTIANIGAGMILFVEMGKVSTTKQRKSDQNSRIIK